jgi:hypothetical protein
MSAGFLTPAFVLVSIEGFFKSKVLLLFIFHFPVFLFSISAECNEGWLQKKRECAVCRTNLAEQKSAGGEKMVKTVLLHGGNKVSTDSRTANDDNPGGSEPGGSSSEGFRTLARGPSLGTKLDAVLEDLVFLHASATPSPKAVVFSQWNRVLESKRIFCLTQAFTQSLRLLKSRGWGGFSPMNLVSTFKFCRWVWMQTGSSTFRWRGAPSGAGKPCRGSWRIPLSR